MCAELPLPWGASSFHGRRQHTSQYGSHRSGVSQLHRLRPGLQQAASPCKMEPQSSWQAWEQVESSTRMGGAVADKDHMLYAQPGPETPSSQAKRALFPGCSPAASTSLRKQGLGCAGDRDDQPPQDVQRGRHPSVIAKVSLTSWETAHPCRAVGHLCQL